MWQRTLLGIGLGLALMSGLVRGEDKPGPVYPVPGVMREVIADGPSDASQGTKLHPEGRRQGGIVERWHNRRPILFCYGNFNDYSCGSLHSELLFLFGSCRQFYGERCLKEPPPYPIPGFDPVAAGIEAPGKRSGCRSCGW
jgi:hypothetical protein